MILNTLITIKNNKKKYLKIKKKKINLKILNFFFRINYILNYYFLNNKIIITFKNKNKKNIKIYYKKSNYTFLKYSELKKYIYYKFNILIILSTPIGVITHYEAIKNKCGGKLLFIIY